MPRKDFATAIAQSCPYIDGVLDALEELKNFEVTEYESDFQDLVSRAQDNLEEIRSINSSLRHHIDEIGTDADNLEIELDTLRDVWEREKSDLEWEISDLRKDLSSCEKYNEELQYG